jgi:hypothetical protein
MVSETVHRPLRTSCEIGLSHILIRGVRFAAVVADPH